MPPRTDGNPKTINWSDPGSDRKLLIAVLECSELKVTGELKEKVNKYLGLDPASQSVQHRIRALKKIASEIVIDSDAYNEATPKANPKKPARKVQESPFQIQSPPRRTNATITRPKRILVTSSSDEEERMAV